MFPLRLSWAIIGDFWKTSSFDPTLNEMNMHLNVSLHYKIKHITFTTDKKSFALSGKRIYTITNKNVVDILFNKNICGHSKFIDGKIRDTDMGEIKPHNENSDFLIKHVGCGGIHPILNIQRSNKPAL